MLLLVYSFYHPLDNSCLLPIEGGSGDDDAVFAAAVDEKGSAIVGGYTYGTWSRANAGQTDFAAVKLAPNGTALWQWQVRTRRKMTCLRCNYSTVGRGTNNFERSNALHSSARAVLRIVRLEMH